MAARPQGRIVVALPAGPVAQHEVRGRGEVEHGGHVGGGLPAGVEGLRLPRAGAFQHRAVVRGGHDELVLPAREAARWEGRGRGRGERGGGGRGRALPRGRLRGEELAGAALTWAPRGDGRWGRGGARPSLGTGRCPARCGSAGREGAGCLEGESRGVSVGGQHGGGCAGSGAAPGSAGRRPQGQGQRAASAVVTREQPGRGERYRSCWSETPRATQPRPRQPSVPAWSPRSCCRGRARAAGAR